MTVSGFDSRVRFQSGKKTSPITTLSRIRISDISSGPGWMGLHLEVGTTSNGWDGEDFMVDGHFLAINMSDKVLHYEIRAEDDSTWLPYTRDPGSFWIHPEGRPFSLRFKGETQFGAVIVDGRFMDSVLGQHYELHTGVNVADDVLRHLFHALVAEIRQPGPQAAREALVRSFVLSLGARHGAPAQGSSHKGALTITQLNTLLDWVINNLDTRITVSAMAARVDLSVAHFSREFKRATGSTPWDYVVEKRLQRAAELLKDGETVCSTAMQCGFFDQAHLSRLFKQRFNIAPSAYARNFGSLSSVTA